MAWTTIAQPDLSRQRKRRRINLTNSYGGENSWGGSVDNFNMLQQVYRGRYDRLERYKLYDWMDQDSDISRALDMTAEHCTEKNDEGHYFKFDWSYDPTTEESDLVMENMTQWHRINEWDNRLFRNVRNVLKYGDWFYFRNPTTFELYTLHPRFILGALIDREKLDVVAWIVRNFKFNVQDIELSVDNKGLQDSIKNLSLTSGMRNTKVIPAAHIVHLSLSEGKFAGSTGDDDPSDRYNNRWPFGESWLEQASKTFKQRELLEDAALIHRVQRAPSRTVWYIDTGKSRPDRANWAVNNFKNELNQKRIPQIIGADQKTVDSVYNPISQLEDIYIPVSFDQRGSKVETLEGQPWNELPDLQYFTKKMMRALRVPHSWMLGSNEGGSVFNDARVGVAYQEEIEFSRFCSRMQESIDDAMDFEFKLYCKIRDVNVSPGDFDLKFNPPTNYDSYKNNARDQDNISVWAAIKDEPYISKRKALIKYLGWTEDALVDNEQKVLEESFTPSDAAAFGDLGLGAGAVGGGLGAGMPLGGPGDTALGGPGQFSDLSGVGEMGATGADFGGGGMAMTGATAGAGGFPGMGESKVKDDKKNVLMEAPLTLDDIKPAAVRYDDEAIERTPDDKLFLNQDPVKGGMTITLKMLHKVRQSHMSRRSENEKRLKMIQKVYKLGGEEGGGLGGGLGGGGGLI